MIKKLLKTLSLGALLTSGGMASECKECHDPLKIQAAATHYTMSKRGSLENQWWDAYLKSSEKRIVYYVESISSSNREAALWFLLTGGKYGFANRKATPEEQSSMVTSMKNVAAGFYGKGTQGVEAWKTLTQKENEGHLHVQMLYKTIESAGKEKDLLTSHLASLQTKFNDLNKVSNLAREQVIDLEKKVHSYRSLYENLLQEMEKKKEEKKKKAALKELKKQEQAITLKKKETPTTGFDPNSSIVFIY